MVVYNKSTTAEGQHQTGNMFSQTLVSLNTIQSGLQQRVESMHWIGTAGPAFKQAYSEWQADMKTVTDQLTDMAQLMHQGANDAENVESMTTRTSNFASNAGGGGSGNFF